MVLAFTFFKGKRLLPVYWLDTGKIAGFVFLTYLDK